MKLTLAILAAVMLTGCTQYFRYPCQNPENWDKAQCQRPICEVNRDCPDLIFKEDSKITVPAAARTTAPPVTLKGECQ